MRTIEITDEQEEQAKEWLHSHHCGPTFIKELADYNSFIVTPGPIGTCIYIKCGKCGKTHNITDYDSW